jgi:hypothetical protein
MEYVKKEAMIRLRVSADEQAAWLAAADREQMSLSSWIRRRCNGLPTTGPALATTRPPRSSRKRAKEKS